MSELVKEFKLKRTSSAFNPSFTKGKIYPTYHSEVNDHTDFAFYIIDDSGNRRYFHTDKGQVDSKAGDLVADYWSIIKTPKDEKKMTKEFKAGDTIRFKEDWCDVTAGKEYELFKAGNTLRFIDDVGDELHFYDLHYQCRVGLALDKELMEDERTADTAADAKPVFVDHNITGLPVLVKAKLSLVEPKPVFVEANITELMEAINNGEQSQYYIYNQKKGTMVSVALEMTLHQLFNNQILRKVDK